MKYTANYNLKKPEDTDNVNITDFNDNVDVIDGALKPTFDQTKTPAVSTFTGKLADVFSWITNRIKAITGKQNWWEAPAVNLENVSNHISDSNTHVAKNGILQTGLNAEKVNGIKMSAGTSAPTSPSTNDIWIDTN